LVTKFTSALKTNLTLGTASTKDIGTGTNQVPDMNSFTSANNWFKLPSGYIVQFFSASFDTSGSYINFPTPFASRVVAVIPGTFMNSNT
ncbi:phage tail protein, partial [Escherichia coli]|nr:phage tail protein [Escherichia coli]